MKTDFKEPINIRDQLLDSRYKCTICGEEHDIKDLTIYRCWQDSITRFKSYRYTDFWIKLCDICADKYVSIER